MTQAMNEQRTCLAISPRQKRDSDDGPTHPPASHSVPQLSLSKVGYPLQFRLKIPLRNYPMSGLASISRPPAASRFSFMTLPSPSIKYLIHNTLQNVSDIRFSTIRRRRRHMRWRYVGTSLHVPTQYVDIFSLASLSVAAGP